MAFHLDDLSAIPSSPGVYFFYDVKGKILYIGKAKHLQKRVSQYFSPGSVWKQDMLHKAVRLDFITVSTESEALYLEDNLIKKHTPPYNSLLKGDNSYTYIKISADPYPRITTTRSRIADGSMYVGPKHNTRELYNLIQFLRRVLRFRTCSNSVFAQGRICSDYHFGTCAGWCVYGKMYARAGEKGAKIVGRKGTTGKQGKVGNGGISSNNDLLHLSRTASGLPVNASFTAQWTSYEETKKESDRMVTLITQFFSGKTKPIVEEIMERMTTAVTKQHFEYAAQLRDIYGGITKFTEKQHVVITQMVSGTAMMIRQVAGWYAVAVVHLFEGKIVDVVRVKYRIDDTERDDIISDFTADYGISTVIEHEHSVVVMTKTLKQIPLGVRREIEGVVNGIIDAMIASSTFEKENMMSDMLQQLADRYEFPVFPYTIECTDISHLSGGWTSGSIVAIKEGLPYKHGYRRYKIRHVDQADSKSQKGSVTRADDYAALRDVLIRRFQHIDCSNEADRQSLPAVFILDGGKGQLGVVENLSREYQWFHTVTQYVHFCSLGKGSARARSAKDRGEKEAVYRYDRKSTDRQSHYTDAGQADRGKSDEGKDMSFTTTPNDYIKTKELLYDDVDRILTKLRDEAHRFANQYRKKQMSQEFTKKVM